MMDRRDISSAMIWSTFGVLLLLWAAHVYAAYEPSRPVWGILHATLLADGWRWVVWGAGLLLIFPLSAAAIAGGCARHVYRPRIFPTVPFARKAIVLLLLCAGLFVFRSRAHIFGDGYRMLDRLAEAGPSVLFSADILKETLDFGWHWLNHRVWAEPLGIRPAFTYGLLNCLAGLLILIGLARLIRELTPAREQRLFLWAAVASSGTLLLGFGYVESYSWAFAGVVWAILYAVRALRRPELWRAAFVLWLVAVGFHLLALIFAPAMIWAFYARCHDRPLPLGWVVVITGALVAGGSFIAAHLPGLHLFVFPFAGHNGNYVLWSAAHLIDLVNLVLLVAPAALPLLVMAWSKNGSAGVARGWSIVALAACGAWWAAVVIDPTLGAARDWDLLSYFGPFLCLGAAGLVLSRKSGISKATISVLTVQLVGLVIFHTMPWIAAHQNAGRAVEMMDVMLADDPHLSTEYDDAARAVDFGQFLISDDLQRYDLGTKYFLRRTTAVPDDPDAWWSLGSMYWYRGLPDSCYSAYRESLRADSTNVQYWHNFGVLLLGQSHLSEAKRCFLKVQELKPGELQPLWGLATLYQLEGRYDSTVIMLERVIQLEPGSWEVHFALGLGRLRLQEYAAALDEFVEAAKLKPAERLVYRRVGEILLQQKKVTALQHLLQDWGRQAGPQTRDELRQWQTVVDAWPEVPADDAHLGDLFAVLAEWYAGHDLPLIAYDFYRRAVQYAPDSAKYQAQIDTLRVIVQPCVDDIWQ
jgi:tetratricopeptide (TPR) repeat protein